MNKKLNDQYFGWLWVLPALLPLCIVLFSYLTSRWSWGLMDDLGLLALPGGWMDRVKHCFMIYFQFGELKWTHALHCGTFYSLFASSPQLFYVFKWLEVSMMLMVWGLLAAHLTQKKSACLILVAVALTFHYLYDQFFFLSTHETTGLLFLGLAVWIISLVEMPPAGFRLRIAAWVVGIVCFLLSLGAKETFLAGLAASGMAILFQGAMVSKKRSLILVGVGIMVASVGYGLYLKLFVSSGYTSGYSFTDMPKIAANFQAWAKRDFPVHVPWLLASGGVLALTGGWIRWKELSAGERFGILLAVFLYGAFLLILLPWNLVSYYAGPLGVFFGLGVAVALAHRVELLSFRKLVLLVVFATVFASAISLYTLNREAGYNHDTQNLWQWMKRDAKFQDANRNEKVFCNGMEASVAIPGHVDRFWGLGLKRFVWEGEGILKAGDKGAVYYVFSKRFGVLDESNLHRWRTVFYSKWWQVYEKE